MAKVGKRSHWRARLEDRIDKNGPIPLWRPDLGECWVWMGSLQTSGHGQLRVDGRLMMVHRLSYAEALGEIPEGLDLDHLCRNERCCNPGHLEPVSHEENSRRGRECPRCIFLRTCPSCGGSSELPPLPPVRRNDGQRQPRGVDPTQWFADHVIDGALWATSPDGEHCLDWTGRTESSGYGIYSDNGTVSVHRRSYESSCGSIPSGLILDHLCRNRTCSRPTHLEAVTRQENSRRGRECPTCPLVVSCGACGLVYPEP